MTYEDDIALLADDIRRWAGSDARIHDAIEQLIKLHQAEVDALSFEARALDKLLAEKVALDERLSTRPLVLSAEREAVIADAIQELDYAAYRRANEATTVQTYANINVCELCLQPVDGLGICPRCESTGGLYG